MIQRLTVSFDSLDRFEGEVVVDLSGPLTVVVGANGSGKSTLLEAVAEVLTFLQLYRVEGPKAEVRNHLSTTRPTHPKWSEAVVTIELDDPNAVEVGPSLKKHLSPASDELQILSSNPDEIRLRVKRRSGPLDWWTLASIAIGRQELVFDTSGALVIDSHRKKEVEAEKERVQTDAAAIIAALDTDLGNLRHEVNALRSGDNRSAPVLTQAQAIDAKIAEVKGRRAEEAKKAEDKVTALDQEIAAAAKSAIHVLGGGEVSKSDVEALRASLQLPHVLYLQGLPDFAGLITKMTMKLGQLRDLPRSDRAGSKYLAMHDRLHRLLKMDVAVDSTGSRAADHSLLIDDRQVTEVSAGTWNALGFAAVCEQEDVNAIVIWDEPETGLHPTWCRKICDLMLENPRRSSSRRTVPSSCP